MKLKKVATLCAKSKYYVLFDKIDSTGEITQWLGDGYSLYPLNGLPILDEETLFAVLDVSEKQREKAVVHRDNMPGTFNADDTDPAETALNEGDIPLILGGTVLQPLMTRKGITFIQRKYLEPLDDMLGMIQLFERVAADGQPYIVAKAGLLIAAIIMPYDAIKESFVLQLENMAGECRRTLNSKAQEEQAAEENMQSSLFES